MASVLGSGVGSRSPYSEIGYVYKFSSWSEARDRELIITQGMVSGTASGSLIFVDREGDDFRSTGTLAIPGQEEQRVVSMALSPSEELLVVTLGNNAVYGLDLTHLHNLPVRHSAHASAGYAPHAIVTGALALWLSATSCDAAIRFPKGDRDIV